MDLSDPAVVDVGPVTAGVLRVLVEAAPGVADHAAGRGDRRAPPLVRSTGLHRLAAYGLVRLEGAGRSLGCELNRDHLAAEAVTALVALRARLLAVLEEELGS